MPSPLRLDQPPLRALHRRLGLRRGPTTQLRGPLRLPHPIFGVTDLQPVAAPGSLRRNQRLLGFGKRVLSGGHVLLDPLPPLLSGAHTLFGRSDRLGITHHGDDLFQCRIDSSVGRVQRLLHGGPGQCRGISEPIQLTHSVSGVRDSPGLHLMSQLGQRRHRRHRRISRWLCCGHLRPLIGQRLQRPAMPLLQPRHAVNLASQNRPSGLRRPPHSRRARPSRGTIQRVQPGLMRVHIVRRPTRLPPRRRITRSGLRLVFGRVHDDRRIDQRYPPAPQIRINHRPRRLR